MASVAVDKEMLGIYGVFAGIVGLSGWFVWNRFLKGPLTGYGRGAEGFQTNVRQIYVPNPNARKAPREIIERDDRHLINHEPDEPLSASEKSYDEEWVPAGHIKGERKKAGQDGDTEGGKRRRRKR
ncbi:hypothetical protein FIBSPDRAFT_833279 [Athelia psychrophila]|uniref:Uncharacterized protein n=1 Tax=Athelia psychrophila TaxID=1759441 RepID=A0A166DV85_9AGAM|nr:hypothetical protein FIBSPDRAFT_833279 [Fibularhizoctonia sp. CBS 109695]